jgi:protein-disulfide isomerase
MTRQAPVNKKTAARNDRTRRKRGTQRNAARTFLWLIIGVAVLLVFGIVLVNAQGNRGSTAATVQIRSGAGMTWGPVNAPVTIIEYANFGCIHCHDFALSQEQQLRTEYANSGQVRFQFTPFQLGNPSADNAAAAAMCAADQNRFWDYHDLLFKQQTATADPFNTNALKGYASQLGLDTAKFDQCVDSGQHLPEVYQSSQQGQTQGVTGTPTFFINGKQVVGDVPYDQFKGEITAALQAKAPAATPKG